MSGPRAASGGAPRATVTLDPKAAMVPLRGRLYLFTTQRPRGEPRFGPNWFSPEPFFGLDVQDFAPGQSRVLDDSADGFPEKLPQLPPGKYRVQALLDHEQEFANPSEGVGNLYSDVVTLEFDGQSDLEVSLRLVHAVSPRFFPQAEHVREVVLESPLLSAFHGRRVVERCAVVLPASYATSPQRRYPVLYAIAGFGGGYLPPVSWVRKPPAAGDQETDFIRVLLGGDCEWGHHVYADSATNGPRGRSLVEELVPYIDTEFRTIAAATARMVTGHSSGGWSSLWLQVNYPDTFGGVWSTAPDPVDFRDFQQINLYAQPPLNMYRDGAGQRRPIARRGTEPVLWFDSFTRMDDVLARGGQLRSFEAVFSPRGADGQPRRMWNRTTGEIDPDVAAAWQSYDLRLLLEHRWPELRDRLAGKLHIVTGSLDTFYLEGAVRLLAESLERLGSDAQIEIVEGKHHGNLLTPELQARMRREMSAAFWQHHPPTPTAP